MSHKQKGWLLTILIILVTLLTAWGSLSHAEAGDWDGWEFRFFGINYKDFEGRDWKPMVVGCVASLVTHELGHYVVGELTGGDVTFSNMEVHVKWDESPSDDQNALFSAAGFISQSLVGITLTAIPKTRNSDFTVGFNGYSTITGFSYAITGGTRQEEVSDVKRMEEYGWPGTEIALTAGVLNAGLTYISLDKYKEE